MLQEQARSRAENVPASWPWAKRNGRSTQVTEQDYITGRVALAGEKTLAIQGLVGAEDLTRDESG